MASRLPMQHIDRKDLYTNLESRVRYLQSFIDFSSRDIEALVTGSKYIKALIPAVVNIVYKKLLQYDITARAFQTRSTAFEGPMDEVPHENSPQIMHRKMFLRAYLNKLCSDPSQMEFWEYLDKVGMMHVGLGRSHPLHVEYIHIGAALSVIQDILTEAILSHPRLHLNRKIAIVKALGKVIWIQNDLFAKWYVHDGEEYTDGVDYGVIEKEGWLHGRKVFKDEESSEASEDTVEGPVTPKTTHEEPKIEGASPPSPRSSKIPVSVCPFSGMSKGVETMTLNVEGGAEKKPAEA